MCKTIKQRVKFKSDPVTVYDLLADSRKHAAVTGRQAIISRKIGGTFTLGDSDVTGVNVDLVPGRRIVQAWRPVGSTKLARSGQARPGSGYGRGTCESTVVSWKAGTRCP